MSGKIKKKPQKNWLYRPTEAEHKLLVEAMRETHEYDSVAQFVREGALRLIYDNDRRRLYSEAADLINELVKIKEKFLNLILKHSEEE